MSIDKLPFLKQENERLKWEIIRAEVANDMNTVVELREEQNNNKKEIIKILDETRKRSGMTVKELEDYIDNLPYIPAYETGIEPIDRYLINNNSENGFRQGSLIQLAGQSYMGKSTLALEMLLNIAKKRKAVFFSFEMGMHMTYSYIEKRLETPEQKENLIVDCFAVKIEDLEDEIKYYSSEDVKFFVIDSRINIEVSEYKEDHRKSSYISKKLKELANQLGVVIILINQMSEDDIKNERLALKNGGDQLYISDFTFFYVQHALNPDARVLVCKKFRNGQPFEVELKLENYKTVEYV